MKKLLCMAFTLALVCGAAAPALAEAPEGGALWELLARIRYLFELAPYLVKGDSAPAGAAEPAPDGAGVFDGLDELLAGDDDSGAPTDEVREYIVYVTDEGGQPVAGATVKLCNDETCLIAETGADGYIRHTCPACRLEASILVPPEGFAPHDGVYELPERGGTVEVTLKRQ